MHALFVMSFCDLSLQNSSRNIAIAISSGLLTKLLWFTFSHLKDHFSTINPMSSKEKSHAHALIFYTIVKFLYDWMSMCSNIRSYHAHYPLGNITWVSVDSRRKRMKILMHVIRRVSNKSNSYLIEWLNKKSNLLRTFL